MAATLIPLISLDFQDDFALLRVCLLAHALFAASQDVAIDALCISLTEPEERGEYNGWMQTGMLLGRSLLGGGALILFARLGDQAVLSLLISAILFSGLLLWSFSEGRPNPVERSHVSVASSWREFLLSIKLAFQERTTWLTVLFALTAAAAFEALGAVQGPFLRNHGMSEEMIGWMMAVPYVLALVAGSLVGGYLADRIGVRRLVAASVCGFVLCVAAAGVTMSSSPENVQLLALLICANGFCIGLFTASSYAMFMNLTHPSVAGTQFSAFMGATNGCEAWSAWGIGAMTLSVGLSGGLWILCAISLLSLGLLTYLKQPRRTNPETRADDS